MGFEAYQEAAHSLIKGMQYMIDNQSLGGTKIYNGLIVGESEEGYTVRINGKDYTISQYGDFSHSVNNVVKVFVPQGNMNLAFFI